MDTTPVWFMRQAGRSLPEYRKLRERHGILDICRTPELAAEVTMQPVRRLGVDAAILFSDIVVPLESMGVDLEIVPGVGPVIERPVREARDVDALRPLVPEEGVPYVLDAVRGLAGSIDVPLIGFAGAPFTLASYLIEGGPSKNHSRTKAFMYAQPRAWRLLMERLAGSVLDYLRAQVEAGAAAVQLFDSWVGELAPEDFRAHVLPWAGHIFEGLADLDVPSIYFGVGTGELLGDMAKAGPDVMGVDWRVPLDEALLRTGPQVALQGNLDPALCLAPWEVIEPKAIEVLARAPRVGHIFNLGHGVLPDTDPGVLERLVELVHIEGAVDELG